MPPTVESCPIWGVTGEGFDAFYINQTRVFRVDNSPRAGGAYTISEVVVDSDIRSMTETDKALLTTWLIDQRQFGNSMPKVTSEVIQRAKNRQPLPVDKRAYRLLRLFDQYIDQVGKTLSFSGQDFDFYAWTESVEWHEVRYCCEYLVQSGLVNARVGPDSVYGCQITVAGYSSIAEQVANVDSSQAFVAMWFAPEMDEVYNAGIQLGIEDAGFKPFRVDRQEHIDKIDDVIIASIRKSRFVVADFTQSGDEARGGVYYEAGFAQGLGLPVVFTCRKDCIKKVHFDTNHYNHIVWTTPDELRSALTNRIVAAIGEGPLIDQ